MATAAATTTTAIDALKAQGDALMSRQVAAPGTPAAIAQRIDKALARSAEAGQASLRRAYGEDTREHAPKSLATAIKYARDAVRVMAGDAELPKAGERRTFIQRINEMLATCDVLTESLAVEAARDVLAADRKRRAVSRAAETQRKREHAEALNKAIRAGNLEAAAEAAGIAAADQAASYAAKRETAAERFGNACKTGVAAGLTAVDMFAMLASALGIDSPVIVAE